MNVFRYTGQKLTEGFESCRLVAYQDIRGVWTNGWGNTHGVVPGTTITSQQANDDLDRNIQWAADCVNAHVAVEIDQEEFDALVDFTFNVGATAFATSTLLRDLNAGDFNGAADQFERWDQAAGVVVAGLLRRRQADEALFRQGQADA